MPARPSSARGEPKHSEISSTRPHRPFSASKSASQNSIARKIRIYANSNTYDPTLLARMRPTQIHQDKERLYDDTLLLKMQVNALRDENVKLKTRLSQVQHEGEDRASASLVASLKQTVKDLQHYAKRRDEDVAILKRNMKNSRVTELEIELQTYIEECSRLRKMLEESHSFHEAELQHDDLEDKLKQQLSANSSLRQEVQHLSVVLRDTREQHEQAQQVIKQLEKKLKPKKSQEQIQMLGMEVQKLRLQLQEIERDKAKSDADLTEKSREIAKLTEDSASLQSSLQRKEADEQRLRSELKEKQEYVKTVEAQLQSVRKSVNSTTRTIRDLELVKTQLEEQVTALTKSISSRETDLQRIKQDIIDQRKSHEDRLAQLQADWLQEKATLEDEITAQRTELEEINTELRAKDEKLTANAVEIQRILSDVRSLKEQLARAETEYTAAVTRETDLETVVAHLRAQISTSDSQLRSTQEVLNDLQSELGKLQIDVRSKQGELLAAERNLAGERRTIAECLAKTHQLELADQRLRHKLATTLAGKLKKLRKNWHSHGMTDEAFFQQLDQERTGFVKAKTVKKSLKSAKFSKIALKIVRILTETDSSDSLSVSKLQEILSIKPASSSSDSGSEEDAPVQFITEPPESPVHKAADRGFSEQRPPTPPIVQPEIEQEIELKPEPRAVTPTDDLPPHEPVPIPKQDSPDTLKDEFIPDFDKPPAAEEESSSDFDFEPQRILTPPVLEAVVEPPGQPEEDYLHDTPFDPAPALPEQTEPSAATVQEPPISTLSIPPDHLPSLPPLPHPPFTIETHPESPPSAKPATPEESKNIVPSPDLSSEKYEAEHSSSSDEALFEDAKLPIEVIGEVKPTGDFSAELQPPVQTVEQVDDTSGHEEMLKTLLRHVVMRLQMSRFSIEQLFDTLLGTADSSSVSQLKYQFSQPPLAVGDLKDQQLLVLVCLGKPLSEGNMSRKWDDAVVTREELVRTLAMRLGTWDVFYPQDEAEIDAYISQLLAPHADSFKRSCQQSDTDSSGYIAYSDFLSVLHELGVTFSEKSLQYLKLLFYSLDNQLDRVPYETFLSAYVAVEEVAPEAEELSEEQRTNIVRQQVDKIAKALGKQHVRDVFVAGKDGLITPMQMKTAVKKLGVEMTEDVFEVIMEGLQYEGSSQPCISLLEIEQILKTRRPEHSESSSSDPSELVYDGEEFEPEDRM